MVLIKQILRANVGTLSSNWLAALRKIMRSTCFYTCFFIEIFFPVSAGFLSVSSETFSCQHTAHII